MLPSPVEHWRLVPRATKAREQLVVELLDVAVLPVSGGIIGPGRHEAVGGAEGDTEKLKRAGGDRSAAAVHPRDAHRALRSGEDPGRHLVLVVRQHSRVSQGLPRARRALQPRDELAGPTVLRHHLEAQAEEVHRPPIAFPRGVAQGGDAELSSVVWCRIARSTAELLRPEPAIGERVH